MSKVKTLYLPIALCLRIFFSLYLFFAVLFVFATFVTHVLSRDSFRRNCVSRSGCWSDLKCHDFSDWMESRDFLMVVVVVAWNGKPCGFVGRYRRFGGPCLCTRSKYVYIPEECNRRQY